MKRRLIFGGAWYIVLTGICVVGAACSGIATTIAPGDDGGAVPGSSTGSSSGASSGGNGSSGASSSGSSSGGSGGNGGSGGSSSGSSTGGSSSGGGSSSSSGSSSGGDDGGSDARGDAPTRSEGGGEAGTLSFATNVYPILTMRCTMCHRPGMMGVNMGHLDLTTGMAMGAYAQLVNVAALGTVIGGAGKTCFSTGEIRVVPGSSATSLLFDKVNSKLMGVPASCGNPMPNPAGAAPLTAMQVATIQNWIDQGANP